MKNDSNAHSPTQPPFKRRRKLIKPRLQLRLVGTFVALTALGFLLQAQLMSTELAQLSLQSSQAGIPADAIPGLIVRTLAFSFLGLLPLTVAAGVLATFRLAGPIYRFEQHLAQVARGEDTGPCEIRKGDDLHDLRDRINEAVAALRAASAETRRDNRAA